MTAEFLTPAETLRIVAGQMAQTKATMVPLAAVLETLYEVADRIESAVVMEAESDSG